MNILTKYSGFLAVLCVVNGAFAATTAQSYRPSTATARVSLATTPTTTAAMQARRIPTMTKTGTVTTTTTTTDTSLLTSQECIEKYTECIHDSNACGTDFEECTTTPLFYTKKPQCNSVLLQCGTDGINALFGTSNTTLFANKDSDGNFVYPTAGSILGQFIEAGHIANLLDKSQCVKRVTSCLHKENVCGADFELCTSNAEFKKQKVFCESTIARCQNDGITELFGSSDATANPTTTSRLGVLITEGAELAAANAFSTCYKVADQCILSACSANPYKCIANSSDLLPQIVDKINEGGQLTAEEAAAYSNAWTTSDVSKYIKNACLDTIGSNKYCYMITNDGKLPTASDLVDEYNRDEIYADVSAKRQVAVESEIQKLANKFDTRAKDKCRETISACAMRSCGSGLGSACYKKVFGTSRDLGNSINGESTYTEIQRGCAAIVNTDANCQYAAASSNATAYNYSYSDADTFTTLFPAQNTGKDPIGVVEELTGLLEDKYNDAAIAELKKKCKNTAVSCIRSLCGTDFTNCYRSRTDVMTDTYSTANASGSMSGRGSGSSNTNFIDEGFAKSMNKVGGVLDFTIVRGLCINTVKEASACDEHLKLEAYSLDADNGEKSVWGDSSVRDAWVDAVKTGYNTKVTWDKEAVLIGCRVSDTKNGVCDENIVAECDTVDEKGCVYDKEEYQAQKEYQLSMAANTLFQEVLGDLELEAQAKYNAKLTQEQNMCMAANNGGIMGRKDMSSTYMWVKLRSNRVPKNYSTAGLKTNDFVASNDLYGSFCRARVTIQSDDPDIQSALQQKNQNWSTAYFAVGDVFTCGSWIPQDKLEDIAKKVAARKTGKDEKGTLSNSQGWIVAGTSILSAGAGAVGMDLLQSQTGLGGLLSTKKNTSSDTNKLKANLSKNEQVFADHCGSNKSTSDKKFNYSWETSNGVDGFSMRTFYQDDDGKATCKVLGDYIEKVQEQLGEKETGAWKNGLGRSVIDVAGAAAVALPTSFAVRDAMRASNRAEFTEAQQEFMNNVGDHIYCFIGADEAGTYGDLIEISIE